MADSADADAASALVNTRSGGRIEYMRGLIYGTKGCSGCGLPDDQNPVGAYTLSSSQTLTVELVASPSISASPRRIEPGDSVDLTITADGTLEGPWYWVNGDTAAEPRWNTGSSRRCDGGTTCRVVPTSSGRAYWQGRFDGADAMAVSPIVWVSPSSAELTLTASDDLVRPGSQVTFTAGLEGVGSVDGRNLEVTGWTWTPLDSTSQAVAGLCAPGLTSCVATIADCGIVEVQAMVYGEAQTARKTVHILCNETGDDVFDDPHVRQRLVDLLTQSGAYNSTPSSRREIGGYIYRSPDGAYYVREKNITASTPCSQNPLNPQPNPGEQVVGVFHTHPFSPGEVLPANCDLDLEPGEIAIAGRGGSDPDWTFIETAYIGTHLPMYIIDPGEVHRLDPHTPVPDRSSNPNGWTWNDPACPWIDSH